MAEMKTSATALVVVTLKVHLTQPWGADFTLDKVQEQAKRYALEEVGRLQYPNRREQVQQNGGHITVGEVHSCRIIFNEEKV